MKSRASLEDILNVVRDNDPSRAAAVRRMEAVAHLLDSAFQVPGTSQRVGIDAIIGLIPGIGDLITTALSTYVIWEARNLGVSRFALARMLGNLALHASIGSLPIVGDMFDALFRVNRRNMAIVRKQLTFDQISSGLPVSYR